MARCYKTLPEVEGVAERGLQAYNMLADGLDLETENLVDRVIAELNRVIDSFKEQQDNFLNMFGCDNTKEFEDRVAAYYNYNNLTTFTGSQLTSIINDFKKAQNDEFKKVNLMLDQMKTNIENDESLRTHLETKVKEKFNNVAERYSPEYFIQLITTGLSGAGFGKGGTLSVTGSKVFRNGFDSTGRKIVEVAANEATPAFIDHLYDMEKKYRYGSLKKIDSEIIREQLNTSKALLAGLPKVKINTNKATISLGVVWAEDVNRLRRQVGKDTSKLKGTPELIRFNQKIRDRIVNILGAENPRFKKFAEYRIDEMLKVDDLMFMVGTSFTQVEGILGEINTMIAISHLLGDKFDSKILNWIGSQKVGKNKRQPSVDIVLRDIAGIKYGIQVKNTMADLDVPDIAHEIGFANKSIEQTFNQLGFGSMTSDALEDVYVADTYNVPYKQEGNKYVEVGYGTPFVHNDNTLAFFRRYVQTDILIDFIVKTINTFLMMYAPDFLYMGLGDTFKSKLATLDDTLDSLQGVGGNYVYIVGPKVYFAHDMLSKLVKQLEALKSLDAQEEQMSFKLEAYFGKLEGEKESFNIVSDLNNFGGQGGSKHTIKMRSSWLFT